MQHDPNVQPTRERSPNRPATQTWDLIAIGIGAAVGAAAGMIMDGPAMAGVGGAMGAGVGWGVGSEIRAVQDRSTLMQFSLALGAGLGGLLLWTVGALTGWTIFAMLGLAMGVSFGAIAARKLIARRAQ